MSDYYGQKSPFSRDVPIEDQPAVLQRFLEYRDGHIYARVGYNKVVAGDQLGFLDQGYWRVKVFGKETGVHRVIWALIHGKWPPEQVDHINHKPWDNRIENLRLATVAENATHTKARLDTKSGLPGAYRAGRGMYRSTICVRGEKIDLGLFHSAEEAHAAYAEAKRKYHPFAVDYQKEAA